MTNVGALAEPLGAHYGVTLAVVGLLASAPLLAQVAILGYAGRQVDSADPRLAALAAMVVLLGTSCLMMLPIGLVPALALRVVIGFAIALGFLAGIAYVQAAGGGPLAQGFYGGIALAGGGVALAVIPLAAQEVGWRAAYGTTACAAAVGLLAMLLAPPVRAARGQRPQHPPVWDPLILRFASIHAATFGLSIVLSNWVVTLLVSRGGLQVETAGAIGALILSVTAVVRPLAGFVAHVRPDWAQRMLVCSVALGACSTVLLGLAQPPSLALTAAVGVGVAASMPFGIVVSSAQGAYPRAPAEAVAAIFAWATLAALIATPLVGLTFSLPGNGLIGFVAAGMLWAATLLVQPPASALRWDTSLARANRSSETDH